MTNPATKYDRSIVAAVDREVRFINGLFEELEEKLNRDYFDTASYNILARMEIACRGLQELAYLKMKGLKVNLPSAFEEIYELGTFSISIGPDGIHSDHFLKLVPSRGVYVSHCRNILTQFVTEDVLMKKATDQETIDGIVDNVFKLQRCLNGNDAVKFLEQVGFKKFVPTAWEYLEA